MTKFKSDLIRPCRFIFKPSDNSEVRSIERLTDTLFKGRCSRVSTYVELFGIRGFLGFHSVKCLVNAEVVWHLNAADGHSIVNACLIDGSSQ